MLATVALDLTQAILIGMVLSTLIYLRQSALATAVIDEPVNLERMHSRGYHLASACPDVHVYYLTGPLFFGSVNIVLDAFTHRRRTQLLRRWTQPLSRQTQPLSRQTQLLRRWTQLLSRLSQLLSRQMQLLSRQMQLLSRQTQLLSRQRQQLSRQRQQLSRQRQLLRRLSQSRPRHPHPRDFDRLSCRGLAPLPLVDEPAVVVAMRPA